MVADLLVALHALRVCELVELLRKDFQVLTEAKFCEVEAKRLSVVFRTELFDGARDLLGARGLRLRGLARLRVALLHAPMRFVQRFCVLGRHRLDAGLQDGEIALARSASSIATASAPSTRPAESTATWPSSMSGRRRIVTPSAPNATRS